MALAPAIPTINGMLNPPSDEESLALFEPEDERSTEIDNRLKNNSIAQELRRNPDFVESRPHMKIPKEIRDHHLTGRIMSGPGKITVPPLVFAEKEGKSLAVFLHLGSDMCGHRGIVHGGCSATLLDEGLARCCFQALPNKVGMTASLTLNYRAPLPAESYVVLRATTTKVEGRKAWVEGRIESLAESSQQPTVYVEASALFIEPRQAAV